MKKKHTRTKTKTNFKKHHNRNFGKQMKITTHQEIPENLISSTDLGFKSEGDLETLRDFNSLLKVLFDHWNKSVGEVSDPSLKELYSGIEEIGSGMGCGGVDTNVRFKNRIININLVLDDSIDQEVTPSHIREKMGQVDTKERKLN